MFRAESGIDAHDRREASSQDARTEEQWKRERDLSHDQGTARSDVASAAGRRSRTERFGWNGRAAHAQSRQDASDETGQRHDRQRKEQHWSTDVDVVDTR